ncbi:MAG TPA: FAD-dependent oxidoreductase [Methylibium sp.]|nr:FAD-dependent oxidoreductase [Methylibium sp.]
MRIAIIGAGIAGVATAYELVADGHQVTVLERHSSIAAEGSFAPAGVFGAGWWAVAPRAEGRHAPAGWPLARTPAAWPWWWQQRRADHAAPAARRLATCVRLAERSTDRLKTLSTQLGFEFERGDGALVLWRTDRERATGQAAIAALRALGIAATEVDAAQCRAIEPNLAPERPLAGGVHLPSDGRGNCRQFAHALREAAERAGAEFRFATTVRAIASRPAGGVDLRLEQTAPTTGFGSSKMAPGRVARPVPRERARAAARYLEPVSDEAFDAVVVAAGVASAELLQPLGLKLALRPVHGYSLTAALRSPERGPRSVVIDASTGGVISRLGQRVRVAAGAEVGGSDRQHRRGTTEGLYTLVQEWFPGAAQLTRPQVWKGPRAMLADGMPLIGPGPRPGVWLHLGHGGIGWSLACGGALALADQIAGRAPAAPPGRAPDGAA